MKQNLIKFNPSATERDRWFLEFLNYRGACCEGPGALNSHADNTSIPSVLSAHRGVWQSWPRWHPWESDSRVRKANGKAAGLGGSGEPRGRAARAAGCNQAQKVDCVRSYFFQRAAQPSGGTYNAN